ncbi:hypothetical protein BMETH_3709112337, partial [methanotrophic bacterial endosymbiont of Bathymodiolus sp.]
VGKTQNQTIGLRYVQKHPHGRGEDYEETTSIMDMKETPPRA